MTPTLLYLPHSPWSTKALCAIHHQGLAVEAVAYRPMLDEPAARWRLFRAGARWTGRVSVPMLFAPDQVALSSWEVARYAGEHGAGESLFPENDLDEIKRWDGHSERILEAGRARFMVDAMEHEGVLRELLPPPVSGLPMAAMRAAVRAFNLKYGIRVGHGLQYDAALAAELDAVRAAIEAGGDFLTGRFSYADIAVGVALNVVRPLRGSGFGPASEALMASTDLADRYPELIAWRDRLHGTHSLLGVPTPPSTT